MIRTLSTIILGLVVSVLLPIIILVSSFFQKIQTSDFILTPLELSGVYSEVPTFITTIAVQEEPALAEKEGVIREALSKTISTEWIQSVVESIVQTLYAWISQEVPVTNLELTLDFREPKEDFSQNFDQILIQTTTLSASCDPERALEDLCFTSDQKRDQWIQDLRQKFLESLPDQFSLQELIQQASPEEQNIVNQKAEEIRGWLQNMTLILTVIWVLWGMLFALFIVLSAKSLSKVLLWVGGFFIAFMVPTFFLSLFVTGDLVSRATLVFAEQFPLSTQRVISHVATLLLSDIFRPLQWTSGALIGVGILCVIIGGFVLPHPSHDLAHEKK